MDFRIIDVFPQDSHLCVKVEHNHANGSFWFLEHYVWQGREGLNRKRTTDAQGRFLMDDGNPAPTQVVRAGLLDESEVAYLPAGRTWALQPGPHLSEDEILNTIKATHRRHLGGGWPQGKIDVLSAKKPNAQDQGGIGALVSKLGALKGRSFNVDR